MSTAPISSCNMAVQHGMSAHTEPNPPPVADPSGLRAARERPLPPGPGRQDWIMLAIGVAFTTIGVLMIFDGKKQGLSITVFGAGIATLAISQVLRKRRNRRFRATRVEVAGGIPIAVSRMRLGSLAGGITAFGAAIVTAGDAAPVLLEGIGWMLLLFGSAFTVAVLLRRIGYSFFQFDPEGFTYGEQGWRIQVPWASLSACAMTEVHDNAAVLIRIDSLESARVHPPEARSRALERLDANHRYFGAHIMIMTGLYGLDQPLLAQAIERYATEPNSRAELRKGALPAAAGSA